MIRKHNFIWLAAVLAMVLLFSSNAISKAATDIFINEIHYDNTGGDSGEGVEIAGPAGFDLSGWTLERYNGNGGAIYGTTALNGIITNQQDGFGTIFFPIAGLQNGAPDGIALVDPGNIVIQFLSYEGSFIAVGGSANGLTSTDIGVSEGSGTAVGDSLQLVGTGNAAGNFSWATEMPSTYDNVNTGQTFSAGGDTTAPLISSFSPVDDSTGVAINTNLIAQFNENVQLGIGNIVLHLTSDDSVVETFDVSTSTQLSVSGNSVTIDPTSDLANSTEYYTVIDNGAVEDLAGNAYQGFSGTTVWSFTTAAVSSGPELLINEVDADQAGTDSAEFVELYDGGVGNTDLSGLVLVFMNGSDDASYNSFDLDGFSTNANGYFVLCGNAANTANCDLDVSPDTNLVQNGADAVALYTGDAVDFPNDTPVTTANLLDAIVYDTDDSDDAALLVLLNAGQPQVNERGGGDGSLHSNQRCVNGSGGARNTNTYAQFTPTPGAENICINVTDVPVTVQPPSSFNGWAFGAETGAGTVDFVVGPGTAPLGNGSAQFNLVDATSGVALGTQAFSGVRLDAIDELQYSTYNSVGNNTVAPSLQINIDYDLTDATNASWQGRLVFEPYYDNVVVDGAWQTWNPLNGRWWSSGTPIVGDVAQANACPISSPCSLSTILTLYPNAGVQTGTLSGLLFKAGSGWLAGYQGSVDALVIRLGSTRTIFDFEPEIPVTKIHAIQGNGLVSPLVGNNVAIEGVVVGDFQNNASADNGDLNGFYVQEEDSDADADPTTSEGIFVFGSVPEDVVVGDFVRVQGDVVEFETSGGASSLTELSNVTVQIYGTAAAMPTAANVTLPVAAISDLEQYEGMLTTFSQSLIIGEYFNFDRFGEIVLMTDRLFQPTAVFEPGSIDAANLADLNARSRITLDDGRTSQNPDPAIHPNGNVFDLTNLFRGGDLVQGTTGVIDETFGVYRIQPTQGANYTSVNPRPAAPDAVGGSLTVASFNVLNYFTTIDDSGPICGPNGDQGCRGADNADEFMRQRDKIIAAIATIDADVVGLMEIENNVSASLADLVSGLNAVVGAGTYAYVDAGTIGDDVIKVGLIYQPASVTPYGAFAILDSSVDTRFDDTRNRPVLAQTFFENGTGGTVTVAINHLKSKGSSCGTGDDDPEQGNCNGTRTLAAAALVDWLATDPTGSGDADFLIIGDLNSYDKEDPIDAILAGSDDATSTSDDYTDLAALFGGEFAYTYVFSGQFGYLDYALANDSLLPQVTGATVWHINADEPDILDYDTSFKQPAQDALYEANEYRSSDHDPVIVGLNLDGATNANGCLVLAINGSPFNGPATAVSYSYGITFNAPLWAFLNGAPANACFEVHGTNNADRIVGGNFDDVFFGYDSRDLLVGRQGNDTFTGGEGRDRFKGNGGYDTALDFEPGIDKCSSIENGC